MNFAREKLKLENILEQGLDEFFERNTEKYNIVFFRHVIEHVKDPSEIIMSISKVLSENGILIIETDNNAGVEILFKKGTTEFYLNLYRNGFKEISFYKLLVRRPFALDPPRHLFGFRMQNLSLLLKSNNLNPVIRKHYRLGHPIYWPNIESPDFKSIVKDLLKMEFASFAKGSLDYANMVFRVLLQGAGLSSGLCIYARKQGL